MPGFLHHGLRCTLRFVRRFIDFEICLVESSEAGKSVGTAAVGYEILRVTKDEFETGRCDELLDKEYGWSFDRDDQCIAALNQGKIVAFTFQTSFPTVVREGLEFEFPGQFRYLYASFTASAHRGKKLAIACLAESSQLTLHEFGAEVRRIWYVNVLNAASMAVGDSSGVELRVHGYIGYARIGASWRCFASPGCRRLGIGFRAKPR